MVSKANKQAMTLATGILVMTLMGCSASSPGNRIRESINSPTAPIVQANGGENEADSAPGGAGDTSVSAPVAENVIEILESVAQPIQFSETTSTGTVARTLYKFNANIRFNVVDGSASSVIANQYFTQATLGRFSNFVGAAQSLLQMINAASMSPGVLKDVYDELQARRDNVMVVLSPVNNPNALMIARLDETAMAATEPTAELSAATLADVPAIGPTFKQGLANAALMTSAASMEQSVPAFTVIVRRFVRTYEEGGQQGSLTLTIKRAAQASN